MFSRETMVANHLRYNFFPPLPDDLVEPALLAVDFCQTEDYDAQVQIPGGNALAASTIVEELHLEQMVDWPEV